MLKRIWQRLCRLAAPPVLVLVAGIGPLAAEEAGPGDAEGLPLWELSLGATGLYGPDYPASDEYRLNGIAAPLLIYRGDILQLGGRDIARIIAAERGRFRLDLSLDGSFRAESDDNDARAGMPDLDYLGEVGPRLVVDLDEFAIREDSSAQLNLELPLRAVFATDFGSVEHLGFMLAPGLVLTEQPDDPGAGRWRAQLSASFASEGVMDYFYEVAPRFAGPGRPAFDADAGYLGSRASLTYEKPLPGRVRLFLTGEISQHTGAANEDSPLFRDDLGAALSLSLVWTLFASDQHVAREQ